MSELAVQSLKIKHIARVLSFITLVGYPLFSRNSKLVGGIVQQKHFLLSPYQSTPCTREIEENELREEKGKGTVAYDAVFHTHQL